MPFGLKNASPTFQRAMALALQLCEDFATVYIDDILIFSQDEISHAEYLRLVFGRLAQHSFYVRLEKCELMKDEVEFLGHKLLASGVTPSVHKMGAVHVWQPPLRSSKEVRQFLGLIMWYKAFIPSLATIASPLFALTSSKAKFYWSEQATRSIQQL